jgi:ParB family chromosome partitioning protein
MYELVAGERRWRAAQLVGLARLPAIVVSLSDQEVAEWGLVENVQREDLSPLEKAEAFKRLSKEFGLTHEQIGKRVGVSRTTVTAHLLLLELEWEVLDEVRNGHLTMAHARLLLNGAVHPGGERIHLAQIAASEGWSYRRLEAHVRGMEERESGRLNEGLGVAISDGKSAELRLRQSSHERHIAAVRAAGDEGKDRGPSREDPGGDVGAVGD